MEKPSILIDAGIGCRGARDYTSPTTCREIRADILSLEQETEGLLAEIRQNLERAPRAGLARK